MQLHQPPTSLRKVLAGMMNAMQSTLGKMSNFRAWKGLRGERRKISPHPPANTSTLPLKAA